MTKENKVTKTEKAGALANVEKHSDLAKYYSANVQDDATGTDFVMGRLLCCSGQHEFVKEGKASAGQIVDNRQLTVMADKGEPIEVIPIHWYKTFRLYDNVGGKDVFVEALDYGPETKIHERQGGKGYMIEHTWFDAKLEQEVTKKLKCALAYNFIIALADQPNATPRTVIFNKGNTYEGKKWVTAIKENAAIGYPAPFFRTYNLYTTLKKNDGNSWDVFEVSDLRATDDAELTKLTKPMNWVEMAVQMQLKTHEANDDEMGVERTTTLNVQEGVVDENAEY